MEKRRKTAAPTCRSETVSCRFEMSSVVESCRCEIGDETLYLWSCRSELNPFFGDETLSLFLWSCKEELKCPFKDGAVFRR
ncbi:hypothetical protein MRB53_014161 [Persea americana]|uniref:Uncharacterized protein n=1 Tax=Persea americana TaxID=3435 RepID=A0ACC2KA53_PERAE|nr:hypothetical protein MRB53_014161 [Persea americana]